MGVDIWFTFWRIHTTLTFLVLASTGFVSKSFGTVVKCFYVIKNITVIFYNDLALIIFMTFYRKLLHTRFGHVLVGLSIKAHWPRLVRKIWCTYTQLGSCISFSFLKILPRKSVVISIYKAFYSVNPPFVWPWSY